MPTCVLAHYDPSKELLLAYEASPYGVAAVLSRKMEGRHEKPIILASKPLVPAELDKEALAIIFGVNKFYVNVVIRLPIRNSRRLLKYKTVC